MPVISIENAFAPVSHLFLMLPDTEFAAYCKESHLLVEREPKILELIQRDQEIDAKEKKKLRILDKHWQEDLTQLLPTIQFDRDEIIAGNLKLDIGRPRMDPYIVYMFLMGRGYYEGIKSNRGEVFTKESMTLQILLANKGLKMPSANSVYDNINAVSNPTREYILDAQIKMMLDEGLDDFNKLYIDSTAVQGNTCWPTDSTIMTRLAIRIARSGKALNKFSIENIENKELDAITKEMNKLSKKINLESGKRDSEKKRRKYYRKLLRLSGRAAIIIDLEINKIKKQQAVVRIKPSFYERLSHLVKLLEEDLMNLKKISGYCYERVFKDVKISSGEKVLSLSDSDIGYIQKGNREATMGYKPQLGRSGNGFVTSLIVPIGNASDAKEFEGVVMDSISRTLLVPEVISVDDGYVNSKVRERLLLKGVKVVSISGSKGKRLIAQEDWESEEYIVARNNRSSVESLMFTIKYKFHFGRVVRKGIDSVRAELLEKVLAYNFCKALELRNNQGQERKAA